MSYVRLPQRGTEGLNPPCFPASTAVQSIPAWFAPLALCEHLDPTASTRPTPSFP